MSIYNWKNPIKQIMLAFVVMSLTHDISYATNLTARQIIDEVHDRHEMPHEREEQTMVLIDRSGDKETRSVRRYSRKGTNNNYKYLISFLKPKGIKGTALLSWQHKEEEKDDDQWLYLPAYGKKLKRIAKSSRKNYFMGTDYTYEDMISDSRDNYYYERLADKIDSKGTPLFVIKSTANKAKTAKESAYSHRVIHIRKDIFFITQIDYYDKRSRLIKTQYNDDLINIDGQLWRADKSIMDNVKKNHMTIITITSREFGGDSAPNKVFKKRFITSNKHIR